MHLISSRSHVLLAEGLQKSYGPRPALRGLSFSLKAGRVLGLVGPNGAGKTTAIRILTTILAPTSGRFVVDGIGSRHPERIRGRIGVLPESLGFPKHLTGLEYLTYFAQLYGRTAPDASARGLALLHAVGLEPRARSLIGAYSRGMRQRLGIARALVNDPAVVFLDEPTLGLDPRGQGEVLALVRRIARERHAGVVLCSHLLAEVEGVCDDVVILNSGRVVASGSVTEVIKRAQATVIQRHGLRIHVPPASVAEAQRALEAMPEIINVTRPDGMPGWLGVELADSPGEPSSAGPHLTNRILDVLIRAEIPILGVQADGGRLQDVFLQVTQGAGE
jgi:ABC-2 type transport system ATP-binding protein